MTSNPFCPRTTASVSVGSSSAGCELCVSSPFDGAVVVAAGLPAFGFSSAPQPTTKSAADATATTATAPGDSMRTARSCTALPLLVAGHSDSRTVNSSVTLGSLGSSGSISKGLPSHASPRIGAGSSSSGASDGGGDGGGSEVGGRSGLSNAQRGSITASADALAEFGSPPVVCTVTLNPLSSEDRGSQPVSEASFRDAKSAAPSHAAAWSYASPSTNPSHRSGSSITPIHPSRSCSLASWAAARAAASAAVWALFRVRAACATAKYAKARNNRPATTAM